MEMETRTLDHGALGHYEHRPHSFHQAGPRRSRFSAIPAVSTKLAGNHGHRVKMLPHRTGPTEAAPWLSPVTRLAGYSQRRGRGKDPIKKELPENYNKPLHARVTISQ